ncbi:hypothetical protein ACQ9ZH_21060 [Pseudomonas chlororaphis]
MSELSKDVLNGVREYVDVVWNNQSANKYGIMGYYISDLKYATDGLPEKICVGYPSGTSRYENKEGVLDISKIAGDFFVKHDISIDGVRCGANDKIGELVSFIRNGLIDKDFSLDYGDKLKDDKPKRSVQQKPRTPKLQ